MQEPAAVGHERPRYEKRHHQDSHAYPGIDAEIQAGVGKRKRRAGNRGDKKPHPGWNFASGMRAKKVKPNPPRHQCFTIALNPANSRPFLAFSTALESA